jgi:transposase
MRDVELFGMALGLVEPWFVERTEFDAGARRLDLYLDFRRGAVFACPECGAAGCKAWDTTDQEWRHLDFFQHEAYLHARVPRVKCEGCGVKQVGVPWARSGSGFTLLFEALVLAMAKAMPVAAVARLVREQDTRLWRVIQHYVERARAQVSHAGVRRVGVDETSLRRGHNYLTLFADLDTSRVLYVAEGREAETFLEFREDLAAHGGSPDGIREICMDMSPAYRKGKREHFPRAGLTFDRFHVVKMVNEAVDQVRREEQKGTPELKRTRYLWLKNRSALNARQAEQLERLMLDETGLKTVMAYRMKLAFQEFWTVPRKAARRYLRAWCRWVRDHDLAPMTRLAATLKAHEDGIVRWFSTRIANGLLEGLSSLVQAAKARARGYRSARNLIAILYLMNGKLPLRLPT